MKKIILVCLLLLQFIYQIVAQEFKDNKTISIFGNDHYIISTNAFQNKIIINKEPWESFSLKLTPSAFINKQVILNLTSDKNVNLKICLFKESSGIGNEIELQSTTIGKQAKDILIDFNNNTFTGMEEVILIIYAEPGFKWNGQIILNLLNTNQILPNQNNITLSPNPAKDIVEVKCIGVKEGLYKIFNENGKQVTENYVTINNETFKVNVSDMKSGAYLFVLYSSDKMYKSKLIVNNSNN